MPFPKLFKRHRTTSVIHDTTKSRDRDGPAEFSHLSLAIPVPDLRYSTSMPQLVIPQNGVPIAVSPPVNGTYGYGQHTPANAQPGIGNGQLNLSVPDESKLLPPTPTSPQVSPIRTEASDHMGEMWRGINDRAANISKTEKIVNQLSDAANVAVNVSSSSDGVVGLVKNVIANEDVKAFGNAILEGIPALMSGLETLTEIHPFLKAAYLPFKLIYHQETQRRDNDSKRNTLFTKIKDVMFVLLELKGFGKDDSRTTPEGKPVLSRLASICKDMKKDIEECYNVLNAQEKRSVGIKFLKAGAWNRELGAFGARFTNRREELSFALSMRAAVTMEEMNSNMKIMMEMFATMLSPQERDMGRWINQNGGDKAVLGSDKKCAAMIKYEATLVANSGPSGHTDKDRGASAGKPASDEETKKAEAKAIAALRKEYREDIQGIIQENLESYSKRFEMGLDDLGKDLGNKIQHQGDRLIKYLRGGPHQRIKDKMTYHVWKDQGWKGSAKTRPLVLALRDYFVERVEHSKLPPPPKDLVRKRMSRPISAIPKEEEDDEDDDPETDISVPLPDDWMVSYLQVKRLRYLEQALDPDASGFTTISEINAFTHARPEDWSFPRWMSYWAIGWQIYATKYCAEIEELFGQMVLLKNQIAIKMPGNVRYVNDYIEGCWQHVTALTSSIERYYAETWLEEKFAGYVAVQEALLKERLQKIQYDIDAVETVSLLLRGDRIEGPIFILLALLMRRHLAKMHLCLKQELDSQELWDDMDTITWVVDAVWIRFLDLKEQFQHQEITDLKLIFEWLSCGLFKNYWEWQNWLEPKYFMENDMTVWTSDTIRELDLSELKDILLYTDTPKPKSEDDSSSDASSPIAAESTVVEGVPVAKPPSPVPTVEAPSADKATMAESTPVITKPPSEAEMSITGTWFGWHWTETQKPYLSISSINFKCGDRQPESETEITISGDGVSVNDYSFTLTGTMNSADQPSGSIAINFERIYADDGTWIQYNGTFLPDRGIMSGTFDRSIANGSFLLKKVPASVIMCARPMVVELNAKELWSFALNAVLNDIRRKKPRLSYLCERMTDMRRILVLTYRDNQDLLDPPGQAEYSKLLNTFSFEEMTELYKLYDWYSRSGDLQPNGYSCDGCGGSIIRSRVVCLECVSTDSPERTVDFCSKPECIAAEIPHREDVKHLPSHLMVRFRDLLLLRDYFAVKQRAGYTLSYARDIYKDPTPDLSLTLPLPASPIVGQDVPLPASPSADNPTEVKANGALPFDILTSSPAVVDEGPTPIPVNIQKVPAPLGLPTLDTAMVKAPTPNLDSEQPPASSSSSSSTADLLSAAVTPVEEVVYEDQTLNCVVCHERVVAPCWNCVYCYNAWVCDSCEQATNELSPWDYQKRYRSEIEKMGGKDDNTVHTVLHHMVRVAGGAQDVKPDGADAADSTTAPDLSSPLGQWEQIEKRIQELVTARFEAVNSHVDKRLDDVDKRLEEVETRLTNGLANIERLLNLIAVRETKT
ncbi:hypothetical protein MVEN_02192800 [Mycena venus]|uniref:ZZ-type domain-containing protein n=1 Tax=Mycena venus TaxID=2733690 RepID=A0A8H6X7G4_9AGAR|nr:hypothetical protein MVEN_02192800 [Mycena venus]